MRDPLLNDAQWEKIQPLLPKLKRRRRGRPPKDNRAVLEGILWVLKTGARWRDVPKQIGVSGSVCWKRMRRWDQQGVWLRIWRVFLSELDRRGRLDWRETFLDGSFAKKGATALAKPSVERAQSGWWWSTARVFLWEAT